MFGNIFTNMFGGGGGGYSGGFNPGFSGYSPGGMGMFTTNMPTTASAGYY